jgi:hypothetical protein
MDGAASGQVRYLTVEQENDCERVSSQAIVLCGLGKTTWLNNSGVVGCVPSDSGGPAYQIGSNGVYAAGIINSEYNISGGTYCLFQMMTVMQQVSGFTLLTR